jgi:iron-sulfur cluster assembly accessory protein
MLRRIIMIVTDKAITEVKRIIADQKMEPDKVCLRIRVCGGGCSGYKTELDLDEKWDEAKDNIETCGDVKVAVDKRSALYLEGASVDFHEDLNKRGFVVNNPMAVSKCGCGSSFSL